MLSHISQSEWSSEDSSKLYGVESWGSGYFNIASNGNAGVTVTVDGKPVSISLLDIVEGMKSRGLHMPSVLRISNILDHRINELNLSFRTAIETANYQNKYLGVFPIKVNQQCHVIKEIADYGRQFNHGFEAGSKAELIIAMTQLRDLDSLLICNGYKDAEFIELGLYARKMGIKCFFVLETVSELSIIIESSKKLGIEPLIGVRIRSSVTVDGHWSQDSGDQSIFGLSTDSLMTVVDQLKDENMLDCLQLLHCHLGSQIPNIRNVRSGVIDACRFYSGLVQEGASMKYLDLGGGLAVDYEGARSNSTNSMNYTLAEYSTNIVEGICETLDPLNISHPVIVTESGRATVAYSSMLLFNILDVRKNLPSRESETDFSDVTAEQWSDPLNNLIHAYVSFSTENFQECYNDALFYRDELRELFHHGSITLRERRQGENLYMGIMHKVADVIPNLTRIPPELQNLQEQLSDIYYGNFSLFQSLPDIWAIDQLLPVMPIHRLNEKPDRRGIIADLTCDCDGKIDKFISPQGSQKTLPLHSIKPGEDYYLGVFLVGAYQETLGDLHNLFGDTNVVNVTLNSDGSFDFEGEYQGDSIADVLSYVEYEPKELQERFRFMAESAVKSGRISVEERQKILGAFKESLHGYTYFEHV